MVLSKLMPSNPKFAAKFAEAAQNAHATAKALSDLLENYTDVETKVQRIRDLEHTGDRITSEVTNLLAESFIVPFDREDILSLNAELDDLVDDMEDAAKRLMLYGIPRPSVPDTLRRLRLGEGEQGNKSFELSTATSLRL